MPGTSNRQKPTGSNQPSKSKIFFFLFRQKCESRCGASASLPVKMPRKVGNPKLNVYYPNCDNFVTIIALLCIMQIVLTVFIFFLTKFIVRDARDQQQAEANRQQPAIQK